MGKFNVNTMVFFVPFSYVQVYFGVSTLIDAASDDGLKAEDEQKEVTVFLLYFYAFIFLW